MTANESDKWELWAQRVREWRASGMSARRFAEAHGFPLWSLRYWAQRITPRPEPESPETEVRMVQVLPKATQQTRPATTQGEVAIEVAGARIVVRPGFDRHLLAEVMHALSGGAR